MLSTYTITNYLDYRFRRKTKSIMRHLASRRYSVLAATLTLADDYAEWTMEAAPYGASVTTFAAACQYFAVFAVRKEPIIIDAYVALKMKYVSGE